MDHEEDKVEELEQLLRDERVLRIRAESRATEQAEKAAIWRTRAEERADKIAQLVAEPKRRRRRRAPSTQPPPTAEPVETDQASKSASRLAGVRVAAAVGNRYERLIAPFASEPGVSTAAALAEADMVLVDAPNLARLEGSDSHPFTDWLALEGRQPFVLLADASSDPGSARVAQADLIVGQDVERFTAVGVPTMQLLPVVDPQLDNPIGWVPPSLDTDLTPEDRDGSRVMLDRRGAIVGVQAADLSRPPEWLVTAAACGVPVATTEPFPGDSLELSRASAASRRWAYRNHTLTIRATELARRAGLDIRDPRPQVAAILVSMRPDEAALRLDMLSGQTYRPLSVVVGLHGVQPTPALAAAIDRIRALLPVVVEEFPERLSLGECLNRAIDASGAEILAKIDDDDFYGPSHIEDGVHALEYSGAGIVGKGAQFTYVETENRTVLRRQREQESFLGGSPTGATMLIRRHIWEQVGFPHRPRQVDVLFTRAARHNGAQVYSGSPWEFCYVRSASAHTWTTAPKTFLAGSTPMWAGFRPEAMVAPDLGTGTTAQ